MNLGFNTKLQLADALYDVQTEDRGLTHPFIDTVVLSQGQVLHRRSTSYQDLLAAGKADQDALRVRVERQHQDILEGLRQGSLPLEKAALPTSAAPVPALEVRLRNPDSWLAAGQASLDIHVCERGGGLPLTDAEVEVSIEGAVAKPAAFAARTDAEGRALVRFPMPRLAQPEAVVLVIRARLGQKQDQLRYHLKLMARDSGSSSR